MAPLRNVEHYRDHVLDAIALNDTEAARLHNPVTPEPDSLMEYVEVLHHDVERISDPVCRDRLRHHVQTLRGCANSVFMLNAREGDCERSAIPTLEWACRRECRYPVRKLAEDLRPLLALQDGVGFVRLVCRVRALLGHEQVGRDVLLSDALAHELGCEKRRDGRPCPADRLRELVGLIEASS